MSEPRITSSTLARVIEVGASFASFAKTLRDLLDRARARRRKPARR